MLYLQCVYSTAQTLTSDISISTKMDMYHYKMDTTLCIDCKYIDSVAEYALIPISYDHQMSNFKFFLGASSTRTPSLYKLVELTGIYS